MQEVLALALSKYSAKLRTTLLDRQTAQISAVQMEQVKGHGRLLGAAAQRLNEARVVTSSASILDDDLPVENRGIDKKSGRRIDQSAVLVGPVVAAAARARADPFATWIWVR